MQRVIWQYWETRCKKPAFVDGLHRIAQARAGVPVTQVTPETLLDFLPDLPPRILEIEELAHKADMIRALLVVKHGGMWLDSDALVLKGVGDLFDAAEGAAFLGFNDTASLSNPVPPNVRINCFVAPAGSPVLTGWAAAQMRRLESRGPKPQFSWTELGSDLLDPVCLARSDDVRLLNFSDICPIPWDQVARFDATTPPSAETLAKARMVMLSNKSLERIHPSLRDRSVEEIAAQGTYLGAFMRRALEG